MKTDELNTSNVTVETVALFELLPLVYLMLPFIWLYCWIKGDIDYIDYEGYEPKEVLQMRFAKGEIGHLEYSFRMSRL